MTDPLDQLESELAALRPRGLDAQWSARIESALGKEKWADRRLIGAMCLGAAAACVIGALMGSGASMVQTVSSPMATTPTVPSVGSELQAVALADDFQGWK